jgi:RNA polymerase sigma-70 factor (ECF subfamily)
MEYSGFHNRTHGAINFTAATAHLSSQKFYPNAPGMNPTPGTAGEYFYEDCSLVPLCRFALRGMNCALKFNHRTCEQIMKPTDQFEAIVSEHYEALFRFAMSLTRAECDAKDLTQHTFYIWATKGHQLRDISKVKTWLFTTLHRAFLVARRKQGRFSHAPLDDVATQLPALTLAFADHLDSSQALSALAKVDELFQPAVTLFYLQDCSYKDIAAILEVPVGTVKSRISRGLAQLREILLSGDANASSASEHGHSSGPIANQTASPSENSLPLHTGSRSAADAEHQDDQRDYSANFLVELFRPA